MAKIATVIALATRAAPLDEAFDRAFEDDELLDGAACEVVVEAAAVPVFAQHTVYTLATALSIMTIHNHIHDFSLKQKHQTTSPHQA
jgi:hypothetical protein